MSDKAAAIEWAEKVSKSKPPRYTPASRNAAEFILEQARAPADARGGFEQAVQAAVEAERERWGAIVAKKNRLIERNGLALDFIEDEDPDAVERAYAYAARLRAPQETRE